MHRFKNNLKLIVCALTFGISSTTFGLDLVVQEAGPVGTYASIGAAVAASNDGDRIIINNKPGGFPWSEDILINKSLTFLSAADNQRFIVQGDYSIQHAPGREVTIIGMDNIDGDIKTLANGNTSRTIINLMWCDINNGNVDVNHNYVELNMSSCEMGGYSYTVSFVYGKVIGNNFNGSNINLTNDGIVGTDSVHVVGNTEVERIEWNGTSYYMFLSNNYFNNNSTTNECIDVLAQKAGSGINVIKNNSIRTSGTGIYLASGVSGNSMIYNNLIYDAAADYGIRNLSIAVNLIASYNFMDNSFDYSTISGFVNDGTNVISSAVFLNTDGSSNWVGTTDGGSPAIEDYDLNLTRNDPGCFGGSYSHTNFFPISGASSKVYYLQMPTQILVGGSNAVTGHSFDR